MKKYLIIFLACTPFVTFANAAPPDSSATLIEKGTAAYIIREGKNLYNEGEFRYALSKFRNALEKDKKSAEAIYWVGECHLALENYEKAIENAEKALKMDPEVFAEAPYLLGVANHKLGNLDLAVEQLSSLEGKISKARAKELKVQFYIDECARAKNMMAKPVKIDIQGIGMHVNSPQDEYGLAYSSNRRALYFTSRRSDNTGGGVSPGDSKYYEDIYVCLWDTVNNVWGEATNSSDITKRINSDGFDGVAQVTSDGSNMLLAINTMASKPAKPKTKHTDIFIARFSKKGTWNTPKPFPKPVNSIFFEAAPCLNGDENVLYFVSERPGGQGGSDIYKSTKVGKEWGKPENLEILNTKEHETTVYVTPDESYLFFSSKGHEGMGGYDIYVSKNEDGQWSTPVNLGFPINTVLDETHFVFFKDLNKAYYSGVSSQWNDGRGLRDIFEIDMTDFKWP